MKAIRAWIKAWIEHLFWKIGRIEAWCCLTLIALAAMWAIAVAVAIIAMKAVGVWP